MKKWIILLGLCLAALRLSAETEFIKTLPAEEFDAAGLAKLTPAELARLEAAVLRFKAGEVAVAKQEAEAKVAAVKQEAETTVAAAKEEAASKVAVVTHEAATKVAAAEAKVKQAEPATIEGKKKPGWFSALLTLKNSREQAEGAEKLEGVLVGTFDGFTGGTIFTLDDGSRWMQQNRSDTLVYAPALRSPKVRVYPASISGFWLEVEGVGTRVRVLPYESKPTK